MAASQDVNLSLSIEEQGNPDDDTRAFRRALGQFATGVTVVTTSQESKKIGMAVNSFAAVSLDPPLVSWSIRKESRNLEAFTGGEHFAINVLASDQVETSSLFGRPSDNQFDEVAWSPAAKGDPLLNEAIAHFECDVETTYEGGDHVIIIGRVTRFARLAGAPLLFAQGQYRVAREHPRLRLTTAAPLSSVAEGESAPLFVSLLRTAEQRMSQMFSEYRERIGLAVTEARVINLLDAGIGHVEAISDQGLLDEETVEDALGDFIDRGWAAQSVSGKYVLTAQGAEVRASLLAAATEFNAKRLEGISDEDLQVARRVLGQIIVN